MEGNHGPQSGKITVMRIRSGLGHISQGGNLELSVLVRVVYYRSQTEIGVFIDTRLVSGKSLINRDPDIGITVTG